MATLTTGGGNEAYGRVNAVDKTNGLYLSCIRSDMDIRIRARYDGHRQCNTGVEGWSSGKNTSRRMHGVDESKCEPINVNRLPDIDRP